MTAGRRAPSDGLFCFHTAESNNVGDVVCVPFEIYITTVFDSEFRMQSLGVRHNHYDQHRTSMERLWSSLRAL